jgi:hypothetical protein
LAGDATATRYSALSAVSCRRFGCEPASLGFALFRLLQGEDKGAETLRHALGWLKLLLEFLRNSIANCGVP